MRVLTQCIYEQRWLVILAAGLLMMLMLVSPASAAFSGSGAGTSGDPYQITSTSQWNEMNDYGGSGTVYFKLMNDLNWAGGTPTMIGTGGSGSFAGKLDGNGKYIKNLVIPQYTPNHRFTGLFKGTGTDFYVHDLTVINADATVSAVGGNSEFTGVMSSMVEGGKFERVFIDSTSSLTVDVENGDSMVGSFTANDNSYLIDCASLASITIDDNVAAYVGGIAGKDSNQNNIDRCYYGGVMTFTGGSSNVKHGSFTATSSGSLDSCFYDATKTSTAAENGGVDGTSKTTAQMKTQSTFSSVWTFDSTHWIMSYSTAAFEGYPIWYNAYNVPPAPVASFTVNNQVLYPGFASVTVTDSSTNTPTSWAWSWGDGTSNSTTQNPSHTYSSPASTTTYTITLTATNAGGSGSTTNTTVFYRAPGANFTATPLNFVGGGDHDLVTFTDYTNNTPTSWAWDFSYTGGYMNVESTSQNPTHEYATPGVYNVVLHTENAAGYGDLEKDFYINSWAPISGQSVSAASTNPISVGDGIVVGSVVTGGVKSYLYDFGDGTTSDSSAYHVYSTSGTFDVSYGVKDYDDDWHYANVSDWITVAGTVTAGFSMNQSSGDYPLTVAFTDTSTGGTFDSAVWNFGDGGSSTSQNPTHTFTSAGTYSVSLLWTNTAADSGYVTHDVTVNTPAAPTASWTANVTSGLYPLTVAFTDTTTGGIAPYVTHAWTFGDGDTSSATNPTHTFTSAGYFTVTETVTDSIGHSDYYQSVIHPYAAGAPSTDFNADHYNGNAPLTVNFTDTSTGSPDSWNWTFGDGNTATTQNATNVYSAAGSYSVTLTTHTTGGYSALTKTITVLPTIPVADFTASAISGQAPLTIVFTDTSTYTPTSWAWDFGDGTTSTTQSPSKLYSVGGNYTVTLYASNLGGTSSAHTQLVQITPSGTPSTSPNGSFVFAGQTFSFTTTAPEITHGMYLSQLDNLIGGTTNLTHDEAWLGDTALVYTNTTGVMTFNGYNVDGWKVGVYKQKPMLPGEYNPTSVLVDADATDSFDMFINTTETLTTGFAYGNATYLLNLYAINNSYVAPNGVQDYGQGLMLADSDSINVEFLQPNVYWTSPVNPKPGDTVTIHWNGNSFSGTEQDSYLLYIEKSVNGGITYLPVTGYSGGMIVAQSGTTSFVTTQAEILRARLVSGYMNGIVLEDQISSYWYPITIEDSATAASFKWANNAGAVITSAVDTDTVRWGLDTGSVWQNHNYPSLTVTFYKYNVATGVWDALATPAPETWTWGQQRLQDSGSIALSGLFTSTDSTVKLRAIGMSGSNKIVQSSDLTIQRNAFAPVNAANGFGGWFGLGGGMGGIFFGTVISLLIAFVAFFFVRDARVFIIGGLAGVGISLALGLFPVWLIIVIGIAGVAALLFASGILGGKGENGGSPPVEG